MNYDFLLSTPNHWEKIGVKRRAGIVAPLFSLWSKNSIGIGEIPDLKLLIDWCKETQNTILQLLPIQDTGFNISPYNLQNSFALNPVYLSLRNLEGIKIEKEKLDILNKKFPANNKRVNYRIKGEKLKILWQAFSKNNLFSKELKRFIEENNYWLKDYCLFRLLKEEFREKNWQEWPEDFKNRKKEKLLKFENKKQKEIKFQQWLQWQLFQQLKKVKNYAKEKGILLKGDMPWLLSADSADVWAKREYFDLKFFVGAPPDCFSKKGQNWGMPPVNWDKVFEDSFRYFKERLRYLENFYDLLRIDHIIGLFRIWKIPSLEPVKNQGLNGFFESKEERVSQKQGRKILLEIIKNSQMLICGENLGIVPQYCPEVLRELGIPGMLVQRWTKNYNPLSIATLSTHDTSFFLDWWENEAEKEEKKDLLKIIFGKKPFSKEKLILKNLESIQSSPSIFCILLLTEWLFLENNLKKQLSGCHFNMPGKISKKNWTLKMPISLETLLRLPVNKTVRKVILKTKRN